MMTLDKACLLFSYSTNAFPGEYMPIALDNYSAHVMIEDQAINLQLWDTAGKDDYKKLRPLSYPQTDVFICTFSLVNRRSFENVEKIWAPEIKEYCPNTPFILVGTKSDLRDEYPQNPEEYKAQGYDVITKEEGIQMQKKVGAQDYVECSALKQFHLKEVFESAVRCVLHPEIYQKEEKSTKKKTKFHLFKNKDKKSSKKDKDIESNSKKQENNLLKISSSTAYKFENKEERKNLEVSLLNSEDFIKEDENKNMFIDENDEKHHIFIEKISQNEFTILNKIVDTLTNRVMCKKILIPEDQLFEHMKNAIKEFEVLQQIDHPCICKIFGINTAETVVNKEDEEITTIALFLEYLEYDLNSLITKGTLTNTIKVRIIIEIIHAMIYIHKHNMIYRDLKVNNVRLDSNLNAKIVDVGLIKINESLYQGSSCSQSSFIKNMESAIFMSPEILKDEEYDSKTDVYSFGMVLYFIHEGKLPKYSMKDKLMKKEVPLPKPSSSISEFCIDLISRCLSFDAQSRPSFEDILNEIRENFYFLCSDVDQDFLSIQDHQFDIYDS